MMDSTSALRSVVAFSIVGIFSFSFLACTESDHDADVLCAAAQSCITPMGSGVIVRPTSPIKTTITFAEVTSPGSTIIMADGESHTIPEGFVEGVPPVRFDLLTSADFSSAVVCIDVANIEFPTHSLHMFHFENDSW